MKFKRKFLRCTSLVNPNAVVRKTIDGVEHIVVTSFTLPENVVMNGIMYPAKEIDSSFDGLNRTLAPVEHPTNAAGQFVSANDPEAIHGFHAGAFNDNAVKVGNRVQVDKIINVQEAMKTDRGRRLLDRIEEVENSDNPRPIHTSTGIFLEIETLDAPQTNQDGDEFTMVAHNMIFDHDAILLDNVGAAQPSQGVGMAINSAGEQIDVETINLDRKDSRTNQDGRSFSELEQAIHDAFERSAITGFIWIEELFDDHVIFHTESGLFSVPFSSDDSGRVTIAGIPLPVERKVTFIPKTNAKDEHAMKNMIINALNAVGIDTEGMDDAALLDAYNKLMTTNSATKDAIVNALKKVGVEVDGLDDDALLAAYSNLKKPNKDDDDGSDTVIDAVNAAVKPLNDKIDALEAKSNASDDAVKSDSIKAIVTSKRYPELDEDTLKGLPLDKLQSMAANCGGGHGLPLSTNQDEGNAMQAPSAMPE